MSIRLTNILGFLALLGLIYFSFFSLLPQSPKSLNAQKTDFSAGRAFQHVEEIAKFPHPIGTTEHSLVRNYIVSELQKLELEVHTQQNYVLNEERILGKPQNIIAKIPGSDPDKKALLLLSHYDSAGHSSFGASDAASGVAAILEGIRAFLEKGTAHQNDIIILFSDAEEIGLLGAELFVKEHAWAKEVGLVLNFEARGSGGPSNMIVETNSGNQALLSGFTTANPEFPVATSLMYSVYKLLPNDTDSTVFREEEDIPSFFFAFIDDHFDYHTALDVPSRLDRTSLAHQGSYLMPLLGHFANTDLEDLKSDTDHVYFNFPGIGMVHYSFHYIFPMFGLAFLLFAGLLFFGIKNRKLEVKQVLKGFVPFLESLVFSGLIAFFGWKLLLVVYPQYGEILQGFTYNGHLYIAAFVLLSLAVAFLFYARFSTRGNYVEFFVAPLSFWLVINLLVSFYLEGAAYFIVPVFFGLVSFGLIIFFRRSNLFLHLILAVPAVFLFVPLVQFFPVGLGLQALVVSSVFCVLLFGLLLPVFGRFQQKADFSFLFLLASLVFFGLAHFEAEFTEERPKPNSLVYLLNADNNRAKWWTYDLVLDDWTRSFLGTNPKMDTSNRLFSSKYNSGFTYSKEAETKLLLKAHVLTTKVAEQNDRQSYQLKIVPRRDLDRIGLFAQRAVNFQNFTVNGQIAKFPKESAKDSVPMRLLTYFPVDRDTLRVDFTIPKGEDPELILFGASNDLLSHDLFIVPPRTSEMIPKPFILNDAVILEQQISLE